MRRAPPTAAAFLPSTLTLPTLRNAAASCTGCDLYKNATQTVFGEEPARATLLLVGEQPGDQEDVAGHPFVGPAGRVLDKALKEAGIARNQVYVTNAVKHFKWEPQGKRRKHKKPSAAEVAACRPWLEAEIQVLAPRAVLCLGVTAAQSVFGKSVRLHELRGRRLNTPMTQAVLVTTHPSAILRGLDPAQREEDYRRFIEDLRRTAEYLHQPPAGEMLHKPTYPSRQRWTD